MKKILLFAVAASVILAAGAQLPERTAGRQMKSMATSKKNDARRHLPRRLAEGDAASIEVPFTHTLGKGDVASSYLVVDANGDGRTWKPGGFTSYSVCMAPNADDVAAADDWMISPAVRLEKGVYYTVAFDYDITLSKSNAAEDRLALFAGADRSAEGMTIEVVPEFSFRYNDKVFRTAEAQLSVPESGDYYFGFHCTSEKATSGTPKLANFSISVCENPVVAPEKFAEVPCSYTMCKNTDDVANYIVIDADADSKVWKPCGLSTGSVCTKSAGERNDDWLITLPVHLMPGVNYVLSYDEGWSQTSGKKDELAVYAGDAPEINAMTKTIVAKHDINQKDLVPVSSDFTVDKEGYYYFGFHCTSENATSGWTKIANFSIKEGCEVVVVPPAAGTLEITPAPLGELKASVRYVAPTLDKNGEPLKEISKVVVTTNWAFKHELTEVVPGGEYTFEVTDVYNNGNNRFEAIAYVGEVAGEAVLVKDMFFGLDNPMPVKNVKAVLSDDFTAVNLSWDPVGEVGEHGGYVDTSSVTYYIFDAFGSYYDPAIAETSDTHASFDYSTMEDQDFVAYQVTAGIGEYYYSLETSSNIVVVGKPGQLPFYESFADGYYSQVWVVDPESNGQMMNGTILDNELQTNASDEDAEPEYLNSHDADNGFFFFMPIDKDSSYGFYSAKISLEGAVNPVLEFWYQGKGSVLDAKVGADGGNLVPVRSIDLKENPTSDWTLARIDLAPYKDSKYIQVGVMLHAAHNTDDQTWSVPFDNMRVIDLKDEAVRVSVASISEAVDAGDNISVRMTVENIGTQTLSDAFMAVSADGVELEPAAIDAIEPGKTASASVSVPTSLLSDDIIEIKAAAKINADDEGISAGRDVKVRFPLYPVPEDVTARVDDDKVVNLDWAAPALGDLTKPCEVVEDFENPEYEPFSYDDFGGFKMIDMDGKENYTFLKDYNNPYRTMPMAYQLFTPSKAGMPEEYLLDCPTHSGETMLVAWSCESQNANLLISPELTSEAQTVSFWARGFTIGAGLNETFSVWMSDTDTDIRSFTQVKEVKNYPETGIVPEEWTEYSVDLPAGTKYFAILHDSYKSYALFLDDISFRAANVLPSDTELTGYNVYCNGEQVLSTTEVSAAHKPAEDGKYDYRLTAKYNNGESRATAPVSVDLVSTGVAEVAGGVRFSAEGGVITVEAPAGTALSVIDLSGYVLASGVETISVPVPAPGVFLVKAGGSTFKINVK